MFYINCMYGLFNDKMLYFHGFLVKEVLKEVEYNVNMGMGNANGRSAGLFLVS